MTAARALIIGGGIGGLCAAIALRRGGIDAHVFEQADSLREVGAGLTIWTNAAKVLRRLDVADKVMSSASITERFQLRTWRGDVLDETRPGDLGRRFGCPNLVVHRADLLRALASAVVPEAVTVGAQVRGIRAGLRGCHRPFRRRGRVAWRCPDRSRWPSLRRSASGCSATGRPRYAGYTCWRGLAAFEGEGLPSGLGFEAWGRGARFAVQHCGPGASSGTRRGMPPRALPTDRTAGSRTCSIPMRAGTNRSRRSSPRPRRRDPQERHHGPQADQALGPWSGDPVGRCGSPDDAQLRPGGLPGDGGCRRAGRLPGGRVGRLGVAASLRGPSQGSNGLDYEGVASVWAASQWENRILVLAARGDHPIGRCSPLHAQAIRGDARL